MLTRRRRTRTRNRERNLSRDPYREEFLDRVGVARGRDLEDVVPRREAAEGVNVVLFQALGLSSVAGIGVALARRIRSALTAAAGLGALTLITRR